MSDLHPTRGDNETARLPSAIRDRLTGAIRSLGQSSADLNAFDSCGETALISAIQSIQSIQYNPSTL